MPQDKIVLLDSFAADQAALSWSGLAELGDLEIYPRTAPAELSARVIGARALFSNKVKIGAALMEGLPELRYIGIQATGTDCIDLAAARAHGIAVANVPNYAADSVAQAVFAYLLRFNQDVGAHGSLVKQGAWAESPDFCFFRGSLRELAGQRILIVGLGAIGRRVAQVAKGFGMEPMAALLPGRTPSAKGAEEFPRVPLEEALPAADVISLHCPLTAGTQDLVNEAFLARCKPGALLINTARGGLVDEEALLAALESGKISAAALDVLREEPARAGHPLVAHPQALVTPHMAWGTEEARLRLIAEVIENYAAFLRGERRNRVE